MEDQVSQFLSGYQGYWEYDASRNRVKCLATGHEMPPRLGDVRKHFEGKKFGRMKGNVGCVGDGGGRDEIVGTHLKATGRILRRWRGITLWRTGRIRGCCIAS